MNLLKKSDKIFVAGDNGMVGSSICKLFFKNGYTRENNQLLTVPKNIVNLKDFKQLN